MYRKPVLKVRKLYKAYKNGGRTHLILRNVNFEVYPGEFVAILGRSGSGKSTLLNLIAGLDRPSYGHIYVDGVDTVYLSETELTRLRREKIGFIFQDYNLIGSLTVLENVILAMEAKKMYSPSQRRKAALEILSRVGLLHVAEKYPSELSGGEKQRAAVARAIAKKPSIILADEPTGALDTKTKNQVMNLMEKLNKEYNTTFLIVTHDPEIAKTSTRQLYIKDGEILQATTITP